MFVWKTNEIPKEWERRKKYEKMLAHAIEFIMVHKTWVQERTIRNNLPALMHYNVKPTKIAYNNRIVNSFGRKRNKI